MVADLDAAGRPDRDTRRGVDCDLIAVSGGTVPATSLLLQAGAKAAWDELRARTSPRTFPTTSTPPVRSPVTLRRASPQPRALSRAPRLRWRSSWGARPTASGLRPTARCLTPEKTAPLRRPRPAPCRRPQEVLRLHLRGRHREGHQLRDRRGLRLAGVAEALHDAYHGALPGADVPTRLDPPDRRAHGNRVRGRRVDHRRPPWSTVPMGAMAGRPFEPAKRSAIHGRHLELGGNIMWAGTGAALRLRRPRSRDDGRARRRRPDRRLDTRQAAGARARRGRLPQPPLPEPLRQPEAGAHPLRSVGR